MTRANLRLIEIMGGRLLYVGLAKIFRDRIMPPTGHPFAQGFTQEDLAEISRNARYFGISNLGRVALNLPVILILILYSAWPVAWFVGSQCLMHLLVAYSEAYKRNLAESHKPDPEAIASESQISPLVGSWFEPKKWESKKLYQKIGVDWFRVIVEGYINWARRTDEEKARGQVVAYLPTPSKNQILAFEAETRVGELVHFGMAILDAVPFVYGVATLNPYLIFFTDYLVVGDIYLSLLQRFHRLRLWKFVQRANCSEASA